MIAAAVHLMGKAGARRIRILESPWSTADPVEEYVLRANWEPRDILGAAPNVEFENTNYLGQAKKYSRMVVPYGGYMFPAFDLNHSYEDCDVFVSLAKMKEHATAGVTLSMKNCFGMTPVHHLRHRRRHRRAFRDSPTAAAPWSTRATASHRRARLRRRIPPRRGRTPIACRAPWWTWLPPARFTSPSSKASRP